MISTQVATSTFLWRQDLAHLVVEDLGRGAGDACRGRRRRSIADVGAVVHAASRRAPYMISIGEKAWMWSAGRPRLMRDAACRGSRRRGISGLMPPCMQTSVAPRSIAVLGSCASTLSIGVRRRRRARSSALPLEGAELAADEADVGEVDVAVDDVGDVVADVLARGRGRRRAPARTRSLPRSVNRSAPSSTVGRVPSSARVEDAGGVGIDAGQTGARASGGRPAANSTRSGKASVWSSSQRALRAGRRGSARVGAPAASPAPSSRPRGTRR